MSDDERRWRWLGAANGLSTAPLDRLAWAVAAAASSACAAAVMMSASRPALAPLVALAAVAAVTFAVFLVTRRARGVARAATVLGELARVDPESGLAGPRSLWADLSGALDDAKRMKRPVGVVMVSLGELSGLHRERGLVAGQKLVRDAAQALQSTVTAFGGTSYRAHGQALVALLVATTEADAESLARRLVPALSLLSRRNGGLASPVCAAAASDPADSPEALLLRAERRCLDARALAEAGVVPLATRRER